MEETHDNLRQRLSQEAYAVTQHGATERPFSGAYYTKKDDGIYRCIVCNESLFDSATKFDSGSGWPSFYDMANAGSVVLRDDTSLGMKRTEAVCKGCGAHLGHVFDDAPDTPTGKRYCINSCALSFSERHDGKNSRDV